MLLTLIGKNSMNKLILPREIIGNYWLVDKSDGKNIINIESIDDDWQIQSTNYYKIINNKNIIINGNSISIYKDGNEILDKAILKNNHFYYIKLKNSNDLYVLYCSPLYEDNYIHLQMKNTSSIYIGRNEKYNHISYNYPLVSKRHAEIFFVNGVYWIKNHDKKFNTFVNDKPVSNSTQILNNGDRISIFGLTIILMNKELIINYNSNKIKWREDYFILKKYSNKELLKLEDEENFDEYINEDYFFRKPRMFELLEEKTIDILPPKISEKNRELPIALVFASTFSMGAMTIVSMVQTIDRFTSGESNPKSLIFSLMLSFTMLFSSVLIPILNKRYSAKIKVLNEKDTIEKYKQYIENKIKSIEKIFERNREILYKTYPSLEECVDIILKDPQRLWERQIIDDDFLTVRLGIGNISSNLKVTYTIDEMVDQNNEVYKLMLECAEKAKKLKDAPVLLSLAERNIVAIIYQKEELKYRYIQNLLLQLVTFHSYDELKLVFLLKDNVNKNWDFVKMLPHIWSNSKKIRFFADEWNSVNEVSQYLESELKDRIKKVGTNYSYKNNTSQYYLIIVDDYKNVESLNFIKEILKSEQNIGFSILFITDSILKLPNECKTFISIEENKGVLFENKNPNEDRVDFRVNTSEEVFFERISPVLSDILIKYNEEKEMQLPSSYTFLEMYNVGCIEQLNILKRWKENDSTITLKAPIGIDGEGKEISLDIHEKFHGPHGLIAGSTGSGKSEFIITYILSLAINYHPDDVEFVLIDYKGGGLSGAFKRPDMQLPHLVGAITNIDKSSLQRSLESIQSELKRRQVEFNEAKIITGESTIDIYKYQKYYHEGILKKPMSHLLIISDEFAELKQQEPEFMEELISVARIGRSLGVHLILATQKPAGVVNEQIRSNSKFGVCLKVQSTSDSRDIIDIPDAAKLSGAGQFYLKVGNEDYLVLGQSGWAGALYCPSNEVKKVFDNSIEFISNTGRILKKIDDNSKTDTIESKGEQLTNLVRHLWEVAEKQNIHKKPLWLDSISPIIYLSDIRKKYNLKVEEFNINPVIGEYDDPSRQLQNVMTLNLSSGGNSIIYGNAESGKETLLSTMIYDIITNYSSEVVQLYILDFGSETMKIFKKSYHVGDVIVANEKEKVARFFMMLQKELKDRKEILSDYNGDYNLYIKSTKNIMPTYVIVLNNYETFVEEYSNTYDEVLEILLREGLKYRIVFVFSAGTTTGIRYRMAQNIKQKIALQMNKDSDYSSIFEHIRNKRPDNIFGRGLVNLEEKKYYEFQTAKICESEAWNEQIRREIDKQNEISTVKAKEIPTIPEIVTINHLESHLQDLSKFPIGISHKNITPNFINLKKNLLNFIITNHIEEYSQFIINLVDAIKRVPNINFTVLDAEDIFQNGKEGVRDKYIEFFKNLNNAKKLKDSICIIIGLDKFLTELGSEELFFESLKNAQALKKCSYIIIESLIKLNNYTYSDWYKKFSSNENGVWLGNGVNEQYLFKLSPSSFKLLNNCGTTYGYIFVKGKPSLTKLLGMKEIKEENGE